MITDREAVKSARDKVTGLNFVDSNTVVFIKMTTREEAISRGVKDSPMVRDHWIICFKRIDTGHPLDGLFESLMVIVDAETGKAEIQESL